MKSLESLETTRTRRMPMEEMACDLALKKSTVVIAEGETSVLPIFYPQPGGSVLEIFQRPNSKLSLAYLQNACMGESSFMQIRLFLEEGADAELFAGMFGGSESRLSMETRLIGRRAGFREKTIFFGLKNQIFSMVSETVLEAPETAAEVVSKGILAESAKGAFDGGIHIRQDAGQSSARLIEHTLLLSPGAAMNAVPGLAIDTNDVFASHSASITRIDDEQRFYSQSRGISEKEAARLIAEGFLKEVLKNSPFQNEFFSLIDRKLCTL